MPQSPPEAEHHARAVGERFGHALRRQREARGWSQERLANRAGLNRSYMGEIERAAAMPSLATVVKLAQALELPLAELVAACEPARRERGVAD